MLVQTCQLDQNQLTQLDLLCVNCRNTDGNGVAVYRHLLGKDRQRPANILYYQHGTGELIGFLGAFFFSEETCEIALMVAPKMRRQGIAARMLKTISALIVAEGMQRLIFSSPHGLNDDWFPAAGLHYQGSEFEMQRSENKPISIPGTQDPSVSVRIANETDIETLCAIDSAAFPTQKLDTPTRIHTLLNDPMHCLFIINQNSTAVGKAHLNWQPEGARFSDVAILPGSQGRGLGTILLTHCINHALAANKPNIILDVETSNKQALRLYTRLGFGIINAHDYWSIDEFGLTGFLHHL